MLNTISSNKLLSVYGFYLPKTWLILQNKANTQIIWFHTSFHATHSAVCDTQYSFERKEGLNIHLVLFIIADKVINEKDYPKQGFHLAVLRVGLPIT